MSLCLKKQRQGTGTFSVIYIYIYIYIYINILLSVLKYVHGIGKSVEADVYFSS